VNEKKIMDVPQPLLDLGYDPKKTATLFAVFKDTLEAAIKEALANSSPLVSSQGTELKSKDKVKAADLRMSLLMGKIPDDSGLLIDVKTFAKLLSISSRTLSRLIDLEAVPMPVHLGRLVRWRLVEVLEWIEADCPPQKDWSRKSVGTTDRRKK
jgi:predicted DNA-binding transcriptional regulator AlpA